MRKVIRVKLRDIKTAEAEIAKYKVDLRNKAEELTRRLANLGADVARQRYTGTPYDGDGTVDVAAEYVGGMRWRIVASGQAVAFLEWGAGVTYNSPQADRPPGVLNIGEYGHRLGRMRTWRFTNESGETVETHGNPAAQGMAGASVEILNEAERIAREVFA
jgi:hypothetical protein